MWASRFLALLRGCEKGQKTPGRDARHAALVRVSHAISSMMDHFYGVSLLFLCTAHCPAASTCLCVWACIVFFIFVCAVCPPVVFSTKYCTHTLLLMLLVYTHSSKRICFILVFTVRNRRKKRGGRK